MDMCVQIHKLSPALSSMPRANYIANSIKNVFKATQISSRFLPAQISIGTRKNTSRLKLCDISTRCLPSSKLEVMKESDSFFTTDSRPIMLFDGVCNLCNGGVKFIRDNDPKKNIRYVSLQSESGRKLLVRSGRSPDDISSVVLVEKDKSFIKSEAVLRIFAYLDLPYPQLATFLYLFPLLLRDVVYDSVANNRYDLFGKATECEISDLPS
ncbi:hypothetical protein SUGI_1141370 [Cryptomeria japonica]|uniref:DCC family protein At1g52590, chloroplastic n=1 Tax=Cryptomeria japonica TaxID=3369 RepID=UPI002414AF58|nr:DCC family protein At1g52590, chloroplastic [Cryptomeria japonica]GLJ53497.1 hypothetical protein SUGI_1141370 [Cryptomeria japonica]